MQTKDEITHDNRRYKCSYVLAEWRFGQSDNSSAISVWWNDILPLSLDIQNICVHNKLRIPSQVSKRQDSWLYTIQY